MLLLEFSSCFAVSVGSPSTVMETLFSPAANCFVLILLFLILVKLFFVAPSLSFIGNELLSFLFLMGMKLLSTLFSVCIIFLSLQLSMGAWLLSSIPCSKTKKSFFKLSFFNVWLFFKENYKTILINICYWV